MNSIDRISEIIESKKNVLIQASDKIWEFAEKGFEEFKSSDLLCDILKAEGFQVEAKVAGIETAFIGSFGSGKPVLALLGEFDALSGLSQEAGVAVQKQTGQGGNGHGCGHNLLGVGALTAAIAVKQYMEENHLPGTVRYYGCPAEEIGFGKTFMVRENLFEDVDFSLTWHPATINSIIFAPLMAIMKMYCRFTGKKSHASFTPHLGRSALDAMELMHVGINYLREHTMEKSRIHYAITNAGGQDPNVVQSNTESFLFIRAPKVEQVKELYERVASIAKGAAMMTDTEVEIVFDGGCSDLIPNSTLAKVLYEQLTRVGAPQFDKADERLAGQFAQTLTEREILNDLHQNPALKGKLLSDVINPYFEISDVIAASSDVGDISWVVPSAQCFVSCAALGTQGHSWQFTAQARSPISQKGMLTAGKILAATAIEVMQNQEILENAKKELKDRLADLQYQNPMPLSYREKMQNKSE